MKMSLIRKLILTILFVFSHGLLQAAMAEDKAMVRGTVAHNGPQSLTDQAEDTAPGRLKNISLSGYTDHTTQIVLDFETNKQIQYKSWWTS